MPKQSRGLPKDYLTYKTTLSQEIGSRIRQRRLEAGLTQKALRERMQLESVYVTRSQFSRIESGERLPVASEVIAIAGALKISCGWLLLGHEEGRTK